MPEGDTIRRLADSLTAKFVDKQIVSSIFRHARLATQDLSGSKLVSADAHGKHLLMRFSSETTLHVHLKMTGAVYPRFPRNVRPNQRKFEIEFENGWAVAVDTPVMEMFATKDEHLAIGHLGPDLCGHFDLEKGLERLSSAASMPITQALLEQRLVAGFGNIYAVETPFLVGVNPYTSVGQLDDLRGLLTLGTGLIRTNARFGPQNTTGRNIKRTEHWVLSSRIFQCKVCGESLRRVSGADSPWQRRHAWCPVCQDSESNHVDLQRAAKLLSLHPCRKIVDIKSGQLLVDTCLPVETLGLSSNEGGRKNMQ